MPASRLEFRILGPLSLRVDGSPVGLLKLRHWLREERKFPGVDALKAQIDLDANAARKLLS